MGSGRENCSVGSSSEPVITVRSFKAQVTASSETLRIRESADGFVMPSPTFRSSAEFELHGVGRHSHLTVGYVQVVTKRRFRLVYSHGQADWEFDGVPTDSAISDSNGRMLPFFGVDNEIFSVRRGLVEKSGEAFSEDACYSVDMADQPIAKICWRLTPDTLPQRVAEKAPDRPAELRYVEREQEFRTWLAVHDHIRQTVTPVVAVAWKINLSVVANPNVPVGERTAWRPVAITQPTTLDLPRPPPIPWTALDTTRTANMLDKLTWRSRDTKDPLVIVPASDHPLRILSSPPPPQHRPWKLHFPQTHRREQQSFKCENNAAQSSPEQAPVSKTIVSLPKLKRYSLKFKSLPFTRHLTLSCVYPQQDDSTVY